MEPQDPTEQLVAIKKKRFGGQVSGDPTSNSNRLPLSIFFLHHAVHKKMGQYTSHFLYSVLLESMWHY